MDRSRHVRDGVASRLKQRLAQILLHSSCTSATTTSATAFVGLAKSSGATDVASRQEPPSPSFCAPCAHPRPKLDGGPRRPRSRRGGAAVHISIDCSGRRASSGRRSDAPLLQSSLLRKDGKRSKSNPRTPPTSKLHYSYSARARRSAPYSCSSSTVTDDELAPFSRDEESGEEAETRTYFSSLSFSSDSASEFYNSNSSTRKSRKNTPRRMPRRPPPRTAKAADAFRPLVSVATKHKEKEDNETTAPKEGGAVMGAGGMAVVKRSSNPYADFRSSMVEMVVGRRIASARGMEELLGSYLSLNSPRHHLAIVAAFGDVWEAIFGEE